MRSVNIIEPLITCFEFGFRLSVWRDVLGVIPFIWISVIALVLLTFKPAEWLTMRIAHEGDSFSAVVNANIFLTVIGTWIGSRSVSMEPVRLFFYKWPRNFAISLAVEALIAQPIARFALYRLHLNRDAASA